MGTFLQVEQVIEVEGYTWYGRNRSGGKRGSGLEELVEKSLESCLLSRVEGLVWVSV